ncbi:MAG: transposase [Myxococcaceae bacterium]|nr:transposase [Myxococcaceae bacterium]
MSRKRRERQVEFGFVNWGGKRKNAGRKPKGEREGVSHAKRPALCVRFPVHVTLKLEQGLPSLRRGGAFLVLKRAFGAATERFGFRLVHHSVQSNHVHLLVEARDARALSRGMKGLGVRIARALNALWRRRAGRVLADRYHARILQTPREVRNALRYVLTNAHKHGLRILGGPDPFSSGDDFDGWKGARNMSAESSASLFGRARSWLLRTGWKRHGLLSWNEAPRLAGP